VAPPPKPQEPILEVVNCVESFWQDLFSAYYSTFMHLIQLRFASKIAYV